MKNNKTQKHRGGMNTATKNLTIFSTTRISTDPNTDPNYKQIGLVHFSESAGINILRGFGTGVANMFGSKGFDNTIYDKLRNETIQKVNSMITQNQKICSCRMDFELGTNNTIIFHHFYGTLYEKRSA